MCKNHLTARCRHCARHARRNDAPQACSSAAFGGPERALRAEAGRDTRNINAKLQSLGQVASARAFLLVLKATISPMAAFDVPHVARGETSEMQLPRKVNRRADALETPIYRWKRPHVCTDCGHAVVTDQIHLTCGDIRSNQSILFTPLHLFKRVRCATPERASSQIQQMIRHS